MQKVACSGLNDVEDLGLEYVFAYWRERFDKTAARLNCTHGGQAAAHRRRLQSEFGMEALIEAVYAASTHLPW